VSEPKKIEIVVDTRGNYVTVSRAVLDLALAQQGLHVVTDADKAVLASFLRDWSDWTSQEMYGEMFHDGWEEQDREKLWGHIEALHELARRETKP
jgi:hypothetical protein